MFQMFNGNETKRNEQALLVPYNVIYFSHQLDITRAFHSVCAIVKLQTMNRQH